MRAKEGGEMRDGRTDGRTAPMMKVSERGASDKQCTHIPTLLSCLCQQEKAPKLVTLLMEYQRKLGERRRDVRPLLGKTPIWTGLFSYLLHLEFEE